MANKYVYTFDPDQRIGDQIIAYDVRAYNKEDTDRFGEVEPDASAEHATYIVLLTNGQWTCWSHLKDSEVRLEYQVKGSNFGPKTPAEKLVGLLLGREHE